MNEVIDLFPQDGRGVLCLELVHRHIQHLQVGVTLFDLHADGLGHMGLAQARVAEDVERVVGRMSWIDGDGHAGRTGQPVAVAFDECVERVVRVQLRIDDDLAGHAGNGVRIFDVRRIRLAAIFAIGIGHAAVLVVGVVVGGRL